MKTIIVDSGLNSYFTLLMALRVLLADESSTIKRVMQLALQDFGVEVKAVPVGLDVIPVAKTFRPDIIFADVLLVKRNGYEVCADIKADPDTKAIPVVLMWSGFMELDEAKSQQAQANARLEKPFDAETLRQMVTRLVPRTQTNPVSSYLQFPKMPEIEEVQPPPGMAAKKEKPKIPVAAEEDVNFDNFDPEAEEQSVFSIPEENSLSGATRMGSSLNYRETPDLPMVESADVDPEKDLLVAPDEEFATVPLKSSQQKDQTEDDSWTQQDLKKFKINIPEDVPEEAFGSKFMIPKEDLGQAHVETDGEFEEVQFGEDLEHTRVFSVPAKPAAPQPTPSRRSTEAPVRASGPGGPRPTAREEAPAPANESREDMIERVIRQEARQVIESICWKVLPEIAERIIRDEINKILRDVDKSV